MSKSLYGALCQHLSTVDLEGWQLIPKRHGRRRSFAERLHLGPLQPFILEVDAAQHQAEPRLLSRTLDVEVAARGTGASDGWVVWVGGWVWVEVGGGGGVQRDVPLWTNSPRHRPPPSPARHRSRHRPPSSPRRLHPRGGTGESDQPLDSPPIPDQPRVTGGPNVRGPLRRLDRLPPRPIPPESGASGQLTLHSKATWHTHVSFSLWPTWPWQWAVLTLA